MINALKAWGATILAVLFLALAVGQCTGRVKAEHRADKAVRAQKAAEADLKVCKGNVSDLRATLGRQNWAVDDLKRQAAARVAESRKAASQARAVAESYRREAGEILKAQPAAHDRCEAARKLIAEYAG